MIKAAEGNPGFEDIVGDLELTIFHVQAYETRLVLPMKENVARMHVSNFKLVVINNNLLTSTFGPKFYAVDETVLFSGHSQRIGRRSEI